ncbi:butyrophilin subfamily 1 member A1-like, partial [Apteryx rowi]|uniref:butyrophilin subfamily 1 member A1-like n=1 Tax=Apteryx rowi TaxID=308060 RepID=UPI000E1C890A
CAGNCGHRWVTRTGLGPLPCPCPQCGPASCCNWLLSFLAAWRRLVLPVDKEEVSLDPYTAHPQLVLSEDCRSVRWGETWQDLPDSCRRFDSSFCVLGREVFTGGRHCWEVEVEVGADSHWSVGVAKERLRRKGRIDLSPEEGIWAVQYQKGKFEALTSPPTPLSLSPVPKRIWVCLDCTKGQVTFVSADNGAEIYTFRSASLGQGRIRPWFCVEKGAVWLGPRNSTPPTRTPHPTSSPASEASRPSPDAPSAPLLAPAGADGQLSSAQTQGAASVGTSPNCRSNCEDAIYFFLQVQILLGHRLIVPQGQNLLTVTLGLHTPGRGSPGLSAGISWRHAWTSQGRAGIHERVSMLGLCLLVFPRPFPLNHSACDPSTQVVGIFLDSEAGEVSFSSPTDRSHPFAFTSSFLESLHPYFNLAIIKGGQNVTPLTICPVPA